MRPFISVDECIQVSDFKIGQVVTIRSGAGKITAMITGFDYTNQSIFFGSKELSIMQLWHDYEYLKDGIWTTFGVEMAIPEQTSKPAKFRVGSDYTDDFDPGTKVIRIVGKFRSPTDGNVYVAIEKPGIQTDNPEIFLVNTDGVGSEYICEYIDDKKIKYKASNLIQYYKKMNFQSFLKASAETPVTEAGAKFAAKCYYKGSDGNPIVIDAIFKGKDGRRYAAIEDLKDHQDIRLPEVCKIFKGEDGEYLVRLGHPHKEIKYKATNLLQTQEGEK